MVRVRMFAALRDAAGEAETTVDAGDLEGLLSALVRRYGAEFGRRLGVASVLVDGTAVPQGSTVDLPDGAEVVLLPPVSGGAGRRLSPVSSGAAG